MQHGRSMVEMLGVLAIIGVLSIGGLVAYRQAMLRYKVNQMMDFYNKIHLASYELCFDKDKCLMGGDGAGYMLVQNKSYLCNLFIDKNDCEPLNSLYTYIMKFKGGKPYWWFFMNGYRDNGIIKRAGYLALRLITVDECKELFSRQFHKDLYAVHFGVQNTITPPTKSLYPQEGGRFSAAQRLDVTNACENANSSELLIEWRQK